MTRLTTHPRRQARRRAAELRATLANADPRPPALREHDRGYHNGYCVIAGLDCRGAAS